MRLVIILGTLLAGSAVLFGAFGSHGLKTRISMEDLNIFETAVRYQMYHALGILILGVMGYLLPHETLVIPAWFLIAGVIIFSGSLYLMIFTQERWLGAITPIGGFCLVIGWILFTINIYKT